MDSPTSLRLSLDSSLSGETLVDTPPLSAGSSHSSNPDISSALIYAVLTGNISHVLDLASEEVMIKPNDTWVIYEACLQGPGMIQALAAHRGIDFDQALPGQMGDTAMHFLLKANVDQLVDKVEAARALFQHGADPAVIDRWGNNALHIAVGLEDKSDSLAMLELLLCPRRCASESVRLLSLSHIDVRNQATLSSRQGDTPLMIAVFKNNMECVQLLLDNGANPSLCGEFDLTPLSLAKANGNTVLADLLMKRCISLAME
ncbi:hypothetical protein QQS21_002095 [Conoideocrella luteorostrata]|uniref:Ankyrin repeat protein n=1 Tax=Conoideocrella luteorostrata TaxID=1105319 RepID=A0AAJ0CVQ3_9HYPO|nr:hypothetical protein QQS21_002095 [Conoideocrella luteorostrata]